MPELTATQARALAESFHEMAVAVGRYRFAQWTRLSARQRQSLESAQWTLLNASSDFTARAIELTVDDMQDALRGIASATTRLNHALLSVTAVSKAVKLAATGVKLAAAIMSGHAAAILSAIKEAASAAEGS
jgi:hypothetical protein